MGAERIPVAWALAALLLVMWTAPAAAQEDDRATLRLSGFVAGSLREGPAGFGVARDVRSFTVRLTVPRLGLQPWAQVGGFYRPDFECIAGVPCNDEGWTALVGVVGPLSPDDTRPGVQPYLVGGIGAAFSEEDQFAYILGIGASVPLNPRVAPSVELRWEDLPGITNVLMVNLGLRLDVF